MCACACACVCVCVRVCRPISHPLQVIIWKETNGAWNKLFEFSEHKSSGKEISTSGKSVPSIQLEGILISTLI